jgi:hypothetical protein
MEAGFAPIHLIFMLAIGALCLAMFVFWVWMLVDCLQNPRLEGAEKIVWVLVIIFLHGLGAILYFFIGRSKSTY